MLQLPISLNALTFFALTISCLTFTSCGEDELPDPVLQIPATYNFANVDYSGQTQRLDMFTEMKGYLKTAQTGAALDQDILLAMYANDASAPWTKTYDSSKQLKNKTLSSVQQDFEDVLTAMAAASQSTVAGSEGVAGVVESLDGSKSYLLDAKGLDHAQIFEKGLMGACLYYQATSVYMGAEKMDVDNETVTDGEGTEMEHHWDEAFGYFGVPIDFPTNTDNIQFWGSYAVQRNEALGTNQKVMNALLKGRAAISAKDLTTRDEAISEARQAWELIAVGSALHYLNTALNNFDDMAIRAHALSEGIGFIYALQFNPDQKITNAQVNELLTLVAGASDFSEMNLYQTTKERLNSAKDNLASYYELTAMKDTL